MKQKNKEIRKAIQESGFCYWQIAEQIGLYPSTLSVWLRTELSEERKAKIKTALSDLKKGV